MYSWVRICLTIYHIIFQAIYGDVDGLFEVANIKLPESGGFELFPVFPSELATITAYVSHAVFPYVCCTDPKRSRE